MTPEKIKELYSDFIILRTYARYNGKLKRRETWEEAVDRYASFVKTKVPESLNAIFEEAIQAIKDKQIMPSMRALWTAGKAAEKDNVCIFNCAYTAIDSLNVFSEIMYLLMNGVGVGFSVERQFISKLPEVVSTISPDDAQTYVVEDSKEGWSLAYKNLIADWYKGIPSTWDVSKVRPKGSLIKTFGGRASGSEVLVDLFNFTKATICNAKGRKLNSKELADIVCKIADIVICGGVRRSACIAFSNLSDQRMRHYKEGQFWLDNPQRALANISVAYTEKPDIVSFMDEMKALIQSRSGERGIVNVGSFPDDDMRLNPCGERVLRNKQLCNLTEVVIEPDITFSELARRVELATFLGTIQASFTKFNKKILSSAWIKNTEEDAMLGVSLTGTSSINWGDGRNLAILKNSAISTNKVISQTIGIKEAYGITCVKPSGTVSQVVGCSSGIHPDFSKYYIRRVRVARIDPISRLLIDSGVPHKPEVGTLYDTTDTYVFEFPIQGSAIRVKEEETAISQLEYWKKFKEHWCDERGNPSVTIYVKDDEWLEVFNWVYTNWEIVGGISFLPADNGVYQLAPYEEITEDTFKQLCNSFPSIDFDKLKDYETEDRTIGAKEYACSGGSCELV